MSQSPAKRRRTSVSSHVPVESNITQENGGDIAQPKPTTPHRASYLSPTKASLSRSHPAILTRQRNDPATDTDGLNTRENGRPKEQSTGKQNSFVSHPEPEKHHHSRAGSEENMDKPIVPRLVQRDSISSSQAARSESSEPELPPTPVQLGLNSAPERPRGLVSSSSPVGSDRHRMRGGDSKSMTSSPLKPKATKQRLPQAVASDLYSEASGVEEEFNMESGPGDSVDPSKEIRDRTILLESLHHERKQLQAKLDELDRLSALVHNDQGRENNGVIIDEVLSLLKVPEPSQELIETNTADEAAFRTNPKQFWTYFAPGPLTLTHSTSLSTLHSSRTINHQLSAAAPDPWPTRVFSLDLEISIDAETAQISKVTENKSPVLALEASKSTLQTWMSNRLSDPIQKFDVGGLVWGAGRYFEENVKRAQVFQALSQAYPGSLDEAKVPVGKSMSLSLPVPITATVTSKDEAMSLVPFLNMTQKTFYSSKRDTSHAAYKRLMLTYTILISWTGACAIRVEIQTSGVSLTAQKGGKEVFQRLMGSDGVIAAFSGVWDLLGLSDHEQTSTTTAIKKGKRKYVGT